MILSLFKKIANLFLQKKNIKEKPAHYELVYLLRQICGENKSNIGNTSSLPANISKDKTSFEKSGKEAKLLIGPTTLNPGPTLFKQVVTAAIPLSKSKLKKLKTINEATKIRV